MERRKFLLTSAIGLTGLTFPEGWSKVISSGLYSNSDDFRVLMSELLKQWCDAMLKLQINDPENPEMHGVLYCKACGKIHGRCMDAVYPFLYMAQETGEQKYLDAGINVFEWSHNVSLPDGSWTVIPDPKSWRGITVFGAIALAEALHYHGHLLDTDRKERWYKRLREAAAFIYINFSIKYSNVNYAATAIYALNLLGRELDHPEYVKRSRELAEEVKVYFTEPNKLLFGEGKPQDGTSPGGHHPVDLGYNVEESLNGLVMYSFMEEDEELRNLIIESLEGHLEFMLPDGGWDNSWGTRQFKWTYWGSRTCDGCQPAYALMANANPAFGTAAYLNTLLLKQCSGEGLLYGGLHYESHGIQACVHHTFTHAKSLATLLNMGDKVPVIDSSAPLPRSKVSKVKHFPEVSTWLISRGPWRATVSSYDWIYREYVQQASGGALAVLYHTKIGLIFAASMAKYMLVEANNQQPNPGIEYPLTPRVEMYKDDTWYTNLYDLNAKVNYDESSKNTHFKVLTQLLNEERQSPEGRKVPCQIEYSVDNESTTIQCKLNKHLKVADAQLVVPIISPADEKVVQVSDNHIEISKKKGTVIVTSNAPLKIKTQENKRVFNMVPGMEALPIEIPVNGMAGEKVWCNIRVDNQI